MLYENEKPKNDDLLEQYVPASFGNRFIAYLLDGFVVGIITAFFVGLTGRGESFALSTLISFLYYWYFWTQRDGQTPGKSVVNIKVIKTSGAPLASGDVIMRLIGYWVSGICFGLGFLWASWDSKSQGWHDKIANTYVVETAPEKKKKYVTA
jgi:uncharacterized RDD family membrane protein YckC